MGSGGLVEDDLRKVGKERHNTILDALAPDWDRYSDDIEDDPRWEYLPTIAGIWEDEDEYVERQVSEGVDREEAEREFNDSFDNYLKECRFCGVRYSLDYGQGLGEKLCACEVTDTPEYIDAFAVLSRAAPTVMAALKPDGKSGGGRRAAMVASATKRPELDKALRLVLEYRDKADERSRTINPKTGDFFGGYSPAEVAAIQGFPPGYPFQGTAEYLLFGQIGNAVPPKLAEVVARAVAEADASFGSANVVTDQGYHRTAISRDQPSLPLRHLQEHHPQLLQGRVLDFGSGRGSDCEAIKARCYDPHHPKQSVRKSPTGTFDTVMMTYVANVLPKSERAKAVKRAAQMVRKGGSIVISTRSKSDSGYQSAKAWTKHGDGYAKLTDQGTIQRFQRFYDGDELRLEMDALVGSGFQRIQIRPIGGHTEAVAYRRIR